MWKLTLTLLFLLICAVAVVQAQTDACPAVVEQAITPISTRCEGLGRNMACYGSETVETSVDMNPVPTDFFASPGDQAQLALIREIRPQPLNETLDSFGIALLNIQADLPNTLPGQAVIFMLMGDATLTNETLVNDTDGAPFQSFYFLPGIGQSRCYESEPMLTIQTPGNITVTMNFNGVDTEFSPGTLLTITDEVCTIHRGNIIRNPGENQAVLVSNETVDIVIDDAGSINVFNRRPISEREYQRGLDVQAALNNLALANGWQEQYIVLPREFGTEPDRADIIPATVDTPSSDCEVQHTVASGENLHRIAQTYDTSVQGIVDANGLENPRVIYTGQTLCIPNPDSGFVPLP